MVLLTHPRSLCESEVLDAARRLGACDRLFVVALDGHGQVEISEVRHGTPIKLRQFHVDFAPSTPKPRPKVAYDGVAGTMWTGDVEAIPYPFRLGTEAHVTHFDFDYDGRWLLTVSGQGTLHLWKLDGSAQEMLPRPCEDRAAATRCSLTAAVLAPYENWRDETGLGHYRRVRRLRRRRPQH